MKIIASESLELLEFYKIKKHVSDFCFSEGAKNKASQINIFDDHVQLTTELHRVAELKNIILSDSFFPNIQFTDFRKEVSLLSLEGSMPLEEQFLLLKASTEISNTAIRFLKNTAQSLPYLAQLTNGLNENKIIVSEIEQIIDFDAMVKSSASKELQKIRKLLSEKRRESDSKFNKQVNELRKLGIIRDTEEGFFNGRRTLAVMIDHKSEVGGFVHNKSHTEKTIFIEPAATISINNDISELEIDERREINRILRELTETIRPFSYQLKQYYELLIELDFLKAKAKYAALINASLPAISSNSELKLNKAFHPILFLKNKEQKKQTVPLNIHLNSENHLVIISGPNAGGKSITLKTVGLLQTMLQSGLLVSMAENSVMSFFKHILIDIGDTQSIENELSTYSARLKNMLTILKQVNRKTLVLMDEFGSGTDPELGGAMAEVVLEELVKSKTVGIITTHFPNVKLLANKLDGVTNGSMLFDLETLQPKYILTMGEPGSSYTFEVAERVGFPKELIERAKAKIDKEKVDLNVLLAEVQQTKTKLNAEFERTANETILIKKTQEKYETLLTNFNEKIESERERKIELVSLAEYGQKYLRLLTHWDNPKDRKVVIKRFIDGITSENNKQKEVVKQKRNKSFIEKKVSRLKLELKVGSKVKVLNGKEIGLVELIRGEKVNIKFGNLTMIVNLENLELVKD